MKIYIVPGFFALPAITLSSCSNVQIAIANQTTALPKEPLSDDEMRSLIVMREEEKLAEDVYLTLYGKWGSKIFTNIASSEQTHTSAVLSLLHKYELNDPADRKPIGVFQDTVLQNLYNQLIVMGYSSELQAFVVGATIEDLDIFDLKNWKTSTDNKDMEYVYDNLLKGSRNHLRAFYSQISSQGGTYVARYLSQNELAEIVHSPKETGSW